MPAPIYAPAFFDRYDKTPEWVVGKVKLKADQLDSMLQYKNDKGYIVLEITKNREGSKNPYSVRYDTYGLNIEDKPLPKDEFATPSDKVSLENAPDDDFPF